MKNLELGNPGTVKSHRNTSYQNQKDDQTTQSHSNIPKPDVTRTHKDQILH